MMKQIILITGMLFSAALASAQEKTTIQGRTVHADGRPIAGATVRLKGEQTREAFTDREGSFRFGDMVLPVQVTVSYLGMRDTSLTVRRAQTGPLVLHLYPADNVVGEVTVSTGFQKIPKERATGSFDHIDSELFNRQISTDVLSRLDGIASSVMFDNRALGGTREISIRGLSTIFSDRQPLIILNNFPYEGDLADINPNDVEDITILKDATAASIWGVRAGNGVIVITTKKAAREQPPRIAFNSNVTLIQRPDMMRLPQMSPSDYIDVEQMLFGEGFYDTDEQLGHVPLSPAVELLYRHRRGAVDDAELQRGLAELAAHDIRHDLNRYVYRHGISRQYALNISGKNENTSYYLSGGHDDNTGTTDGGYKRYSLRSDNTFTLSEKLSLDAALFLAHTATTEGRPTNFSSLYPYARFADNAGNALPVERYYRSIYLQEARDQGLLDWEYRPLEEIGLVDNVQKTSSQIFNAGLNYAIGRGFGAEIKYQFEHAQGRGRSLRNMQTYYTRNQINTYTQIDPNGDLFHAVPLGDILGESVNSSASQSLRLQLNYWNCNSKSETF